MTATGDGWWRWDGPASGAGRATARHPVRAGTTGRRHGIRTVGPRLRVRARRGRARPARPAQRLAAARRARPEPHLRPVRLRLDRRRLARAPFRRRRARLGGLRAAHRHLHPRGHPRLRPDPPRPPGRPRRRRRRADAGRRLPRSLGLGLRRRRPLGGARRLRRPGRPCSGSSTPATPAAWGSRSTSCTTTSGPAATTSRGSAPTSPRRTTPRGARPSTSTTRAAGRCASSWSRARCAGSATSTSTPCASTPCTSSRTTRSGTTWPSCPTPWRPSPRRSAARSTSWPRATSTTPRWSPRPPQGGRGMTAQWDDDVHHALHVALTGEAHGYYADFSGGGARDEAGPLGVLAKVLTRGFLHDGTLSTFRGRAVGPPGRRRPPRRPAPAGLPADPRPGRQPDGGRPRLGRPRPRPAGRRGRALPARPDHADDLHGRGVGGIHAVAVLHQLRRRRARRRGAARPPRRVRGARLVGGRRARPAGPRDPRRLGARLGRGRTPATTAGCCSGTPRAPALRRELLGDGPTRFADVAVPTTRTRGGW